MTQPAWQSNAAETLLAGRVDYLCAACHERIPPDEHVFADETGPLAVGERMTRTTCTYHLEHIPHTED